MSLWPMYSLSNMLCNVCYLARTRSEFHFSLTKIHIFYFCMCMEKTFSNHYGSSKWRCLENCAGLRNGPWIFQHFFFGWCFVVLKGKGKLGKNYLQHFVKNHANYGGLKVTMTKSKALFLFLMVCPGIELLKVG